MAPRWIVAVCAIRAAAIADIKVEGAVVAKEDGTGKVGAREEECWDGGIVYTGCL